MRNKRPVTHELAKPVVKHLLLLQPAVRLWSSRDGSNKGLQFEFAFGIFAALPCWQLLTVLSTGDAMMRKPPAWLVAVPAPRLPHSCMSEWKKTKTLQIWSEEG
jgi:hypothetical protein